jgi:hypothetical protein
MILSVAHKFVFVRGRKVGGTSVEIALSTICGPDDIVTPLIGVDERTRQALNGRCGNYSDHPDIEAAYATLVRQTPASQLHLLHKPPANYSAHTSLSQIIARYPGSLEGFQVVCVARCPYARVLSALNMKETFDAYQRGGDMRSEPGTWARAFDETMESGGLQIYMNMGIYRDPTGSMAMHVLRYERLQDDFDAFTAALGVTHRIPLPHAKKGLMSNSFRPAEILRRDQIDTINAMFTEEFEIFGYARQ